MIAPVALAGGGGVLHFLAYVGWGVWPLAFVSLVPLWLALESERAPRARDAALAGFAFGFVAHAGGFAFLLRLVDPFLGGSALLGGALWLAHGAWFALGWALASAAHHRARRRGWPVALAGSATLLAREWLWPSLFPVNAGAALVDRTAWVQIADLGGPLLLTALVALPNAAIVEVALAAAGRRAAPFATALGAPVALLGAWSYGTVREREVDAATAAAPELRVGVVQANLAVTEKRRDPLLVHRRHLEQSRELVASAPIDLLVWPETVYSGGLAGPPPLSGATIRDDLRVPLLFGAVSVRAVDGMRRTYNSALLVGADGTIRSAYDKNLLVPFTETVPLAAAVPSLAAVFPHAQRFGAGAGAPPLLLGDFRIATPICSESVEADYVRRMVAVGNPHLLVSLANDAWFGDSQEPWIHLAIARLRAVEHHRFLVNATNSGVSAIVDPLGRVVARTAVGTRENLVGTVRMLDGLTVYARAGDWPGWLAVSTLAVALLGRRRTERALFARPA